MLFLSFTFFLRTLVQGDQLKCVDPRTGRGERGLNIADFGRTYFMDGLYYEILKNKMHNFI